MTTTTVEIIHRPRAPVPIEDFASPEKRKEWIEQKGLKAFSLFSPNHRETEVDLFIDDPLGFAAAEARAVRFRYLQDVEMPVVSVAELLKLKREASRPKDIVDIHELLALYPEEK